MELILTDISKSFDNQRVLSSLNFTFKKNCVYGLIGNNGSGKTTLLKIISGLLVQDKGQINLSHNVLNKITSYIDNNRRSFFLRLTAYENLIYFGALNNLRKDEVTQLLEQYSNYINTSFIDRAVNELSVGQVQILNIIRGLMKKPKIIIFDEALSTLDKKNLEDTEILIDHYSTENEIISIICSHDLKYLKKTTREILKI